MSLDDRQHPFEPSESRTAETLVQLIRTLSLHRLLSHKGQGVLRVSPDVFFSLIDLASALPEEDAAVIAPNSDGGTMRIDRHGIGKLELLLAAEALYFKVPCDALTIEIDFFAPPKSIFIE